MLRYFIVFVILGIGVCLFLWKMYNTAKDSEPRTRYSETNYAHAVRQLDILLSDPMKISSKEWEDQTRKVIENYYGNK